MARLEFLTILYLLESLLKKGEADEALKVIQKVIREAESRRGEG